MMKKTFFVCLLAAFAGIGTAAAQKTVTIGTGTDSIVTAPINTLYKYSLVEQLYLASELNIPVGTVITSLSFYHVRRSQATGSFDHDVEVYLKNTEKSVFNGSSDYLTPLACEKVYSGKFSATASGWITLQLATPFVYTGGNLMVAIDDNTGSISGNAFLFRSHTTTFQSRFSFYNNDDNPNVDSLSSYTGYTTTGTTRANIRISYTGCLNNPAAVGGGTDSNVTTPMNMVYKYSLVENLYLGSELNIPNGATIKSLSFYYVRTKNATTNMSRNVVIYMKNTTKTSFSSNTDYITPTSSDQVYSGTLSASASGWITIDLSQGFTYTGDNIMIAVDDNTGSVSDDFCHRFRTHNTANSMRFSFYNDTHNPDISSLDSYSGSKTFGTSRANVRLSYTPNYAAAALPYSCDFTSSTENGNWVLKNILDDGLAAWHIGEGMLFTNGYNPSGKMTTVLAERTLKTKYYDSITVSFDCHLNGERLSNGNYDYLAVFFVPTDENWNASVDISSTNISWLGSSSDYDLPYMLHFGNSANLHNTKLTKVNGRLTVTLANPNPDRNCKLVFVWRNDEFGGSGEGASIKNISVTGKINPMEYTPQSTAQWYGFAASTYISPSPSWIGKFISFTMDDLEHVSAASEEVDENFASTYAEGYVWYITSGETRNLIRAQLDPNTHTISGRVTIQMSSDMLSRNVKSMSYNPVDMKMYFVAGDYKLYRVDLSDPEHYTVMGTMTDTLQTFAIDKDGEAYGIVFRTGDLVKVNLNNGATTFIGSTGISANYVQSMAFDYNTGELFWAQCASENREYMYCVNPATGEAKKVGFVGGIPGTEVTGLFMVPSADGITDAKENNLEVYPNPVADVLNVKGFSENATILVYDATGRLVLRTAASKGETAHISTAALAEGVYYLKAGSAVRKLIIAR